MKPLTGALTLLALGCSGPSPAPPAPPAPPAATASVPDSDSMTPDSAMAIMEAYRAGQLTADSAAKALVAASRAAGSSFAFEMDAPLRAAIQREIARQRPRE